MTKKRRIILLKYLIVWGNFFRCKYLYSWSEYRRLILKIEYALLKIIIIIIILAEPISYVQAEPTVTYYVPQSKIIFTFVYFILMCIISWM